MTDSQVARIRKDETVTDNQGCSWVATHDALTFLDSNARVTVRRGWRSQVLTCQSIDFTPSLPQCRFGGCNRLVEDGIGPVCARCAAKFRSYGRLAVVLGLSNNPIYKGTS